MVLFVYLLRFLRRLFVSDSLPDVPGLREMAPSFLRAFLDTARAVAVDPDYLAALISHESRFRPDAENSSSHSVGLLQWMPAYVGAIGTTTAALKKMSATEQLAYVAKSFARWRGTLVPRDVAIANGVPAYVGKPDETVAIDRATSPETYERNKGLDRDGDGRITVGEIRDDVERLVIDAKSRPRIPVPSADPPSAGNDAGGFFAMLGLGVAIVGLIWKARA